MRFLRKILLPFSWVYGLVTYLRNLLFKYKLLKVEKVDASVISVGNLSVGGTGKTPHVKFLTNLLRQNFKPAVLLRGYGRKSKGYVYVGENATPETVGDEALLYKKNFGNEVQIAVSESRVKGAKTLLKTKKPPSIIILDDAFQHRHIYRDLDILLIDYNRPFWKDLVLPAGNLREFSFGKNRADILIMTKCPDNLSQDEKQKIREKVSPKNNQYLFFSKIVYGEILPFNKHEFVLPERIILVTGIANSKPLFDYCSKLSKVNHVKFKDHYDYNEEDLNQIHQLFDKFAEENKLILTTEKDYVRLKKIGLFKNTIDYPWFYQCMDIEIDELDKFKEVINERIGKV